MDSQEYPMEGIIYDFKSRSFLMAPDYWVYWPRVQKPGTQTLAGVQSPPGVWWEQRGHWRETWNRLANGSVDGKAFPFRPMIEPYGKKSPKKWWMWLEGKKSKGTSRLPEAAAGVGKDGKDGKAAAGGGQGKGKGGGGAGGPTEEELLALWGRPLGEDKCKLFGKGMARGKEDKKYENALGCFCPGPRCIWQDKGFFGGAEPEQLAWIQDNMMRRQTIPGLSDAISGDPSSLRHATVRLDRLQNWAGKEPATLDPRPPRLVDNSWRPGRKMPSVKPYSVSGLLGDLANQGLKTMGNSVMQAALGADLMAMKAYNRITTLQPEWRANFMKYKKAKAMYDAEQQEEADKLMKGNEEAVSNEKRKKKRGLKAIMEQPPEPLWKPDPPTKFQDEYEAPYRHFWPSMEILARREGSGPGRLIDELGAEWRSSRVPPAEQVDAVKNIAQSASADVRAAKAALGGPLGNKEESIDAVDLQMPIRQPEIQQARPRDRDGIPTSVVPDSPKAYVAKWAPPEIPSVEKKIDELEIQMKDLVRAESKGKVEVERLRGELSDIDKVDATKMNLEQLAKKQAVIADLQRAKQEHKDAVDKSNGLQDEMIRLSKTKGRSFVKMYPAGKDGYGVAAKVPIEAVRALDPPDGKSLPSETTYSCMYSFGTVCNTSFMVRSFQKAHNARRRRELLHRSSEQRRPCRGLSFL